MTENIATDLQADANPYPGLRPFHIDEHHLFFGREGQSDEVLMLLSKHRFVGILGPQEAVNLLLFTAECSLFYTEVF